MPSDQSQASYNSTDSPLLPPQQVSRENIVRVLDTILEGEGETIILYGPDGIGKTNLLEQFALAHTEQSFALFVSGASRWAHDPNDLAADLYTQIEQRVRSQVTELEEVDALRLGKAFLRLRRFMDREGWAVAYFILDGLEDLPQEDEATRRQLIGLLPFGRDRRFRFLLSSRRPGDLPLDETVRRATREYLLPAFGREEVKQFLTGSGLEASQIEEIAHVTKGIPGRLVKVRRLLSSAADAQELIQQLPAEAPELFRLEWASVDRNDYSTMLILALLAHEPRPFTAPGIAELLNFSASEVEERLKGKTFLHCDEAGRWSYLTEADRRFARAELEGLRHAVNERIIEFHLRDPESPAALQDLPSYFTSANRLRDLVDYLSPERFARLYRTAASLSIVQQQVDRGIDAARELGRKDDLVRFTLQKAAINEIALSETTISEVRALTAVGDIDTAVALAEAESRIEAKFQLLAAIIRAHKDSGLTPNPNLLQRVERLVEEVDPEALGDQRISAALDLFHFLPEVAIRLVSEGQRVGGEGEHGFDWGVLRLNLQAQLTEADPNARRQAEKQHANVADPGLRTLSTAATLLLAGMSADQVLTHAERLQGTSEHLFILRHWLLANRHATDAVKVLDESLRLAVQAKSYAVNASVYRQIAVVLPYLGTAQEAGYYINAIDAQRAVLERAGPEGEFFRLQLILARTQWKWDQEKGLNRLLELYTIAGEIDDPIVRLEATARLAGTLARMDPGRQSDGELHAIVDYELDQRFDEALAWTADHTDTARGVIQALVGPRPEKVLELIPRINTEWRRDRAYLEFVTEASTVATEEISPPAVHSALDAIVDPHVYDDALVTLAMNFAERPMSVQEKSNLKDLVLRARDLRSAEQRAKVCSSLASWLGGRGGAHAAAADALLDAAANAWNALELDWKKLDVTAEIIASLARTESEVARAYTEEYNRIKDRLLLPDKETVVAARIGLLLALRAYSGLVAHKLADIPRDEARLLAAIGNFGTVEDQILLFSELAIYYYFADRPDLCKAIVEDRLTTLLYAIPTADPLHRTYLFVNAFPAVHLGAPGTASALLAELDTVARDDALYGAAWVQLAKVTRRDSYKSSRRGFEIGYEEASRVVSLMERMEADTSIYALLVAIVDSLDPAEHAGRVNRQQMAALVGRLDTLINEKFPNNRFIRHAGYRVASQAQLNRLRHRADAISTEQLKDQALEIANVSDRAFVLGIIASTVRDKRDRDSVVDAAVAVLDSLPVVSERNERYTTLSELLSEVDASRSKEMAFKAQRLLLGGEGASADARRRSLVRVAHRLGSDFAASIASAFSDDPAKDQVEQQMQLYALADSITATRRKTGPPAEPRTPFDMSRAAWMKLGELNAGLTRSIPPEEALPYLQYASVQPVSESYPIFAWFIQNAVRRLQHGSAEVRQFVLPLFEACLRGAELAIYAGSAHHRTASHTVEMGSLGDQESTTTLLVDEGHRPEALAALNEWLVSLADETLTIIDPYFGPSSVDLLKLVQEISPHREILIVTGPEAVRRASKPYVDAYRASWRFYSSEDPPLARVMILQTRGSQECPVHDRWWLAGDRGLHIGTSVNGLGGRLSTVRDIPVEEVAAVRGAVDPYISGRKLLFKGERLDVDAFAL